jgi:hypothetical protein
VLVLLAGAVVADLFVNKLLDTPEERLGLAVLLASGFLLKRPTKGLQTKLGQLQDEKERGLT